MPHRNSKNELTVRELIEQLQDCDPNAIIKVSYTSSDYWRTRIAKDIVNIEDNVEVEHSDYHGCDKIIDEDFSTDDEDRRIVVLINL